MQIRRAEIHRRRIPGMRGMGVLCADGSDDTVNGCANDNGIATQVVVNSDPVLSCLPAGSQGPLQPGQVWCDTGTTVSSAVGCMPSGSQGPLQPGQVWCATGTVTPPPSAPVCLPVGSMGPLAPGQTFCDGTTAPAGGWTSTLTPTSGLSTTALLIGAAAIIGLVVLMNR